MKRAHGFDNLKCILIFFVVFGHFLEIHGTFPILYRMIYLFHMPVFMFVSGYFAKFGVKQLLDKIWMYGLFQVLYIWFERGVKPAETPFQFTTPYWILWYLFVMIFYTALLPLYRAKSGKKRIAALGVSVCLSLAAGFAESIGYPLSLSRFFVFQPYFLMGLYAKEQGISKIGTTAFIGLSAGAVLSLGVAFIPMVTSRLLYGSACYRSASDLFLRLLLFVVSCIWIAFSWGAKDRMDRKVPLLSAIGKNTLPVYLLHGFILRAASYGKIPVPQNIFMLSLYTAVILLVFGNDVVAKAIGFLSPIRFWKRK